MPFACRLIPLVRLAALLLLGVLAAVPARATSIVTTPEQIVALSNAQDGRFLASTGDYRFLALTNGEDFAAAWIEEGVASLPDYVRIRAAASGAYLYVENGQLRLGAIREDWVNALWRPDAAGAGTLVAGETIGGVWVPYALGLSASGAPVLTSLANGWQIGNGQPPVQYQWMTQAYPPAAPAGTATAQGPQAGLTTQVTFLNAVGAPLQLFWIAPNGQTRLLGTLPANSVTPLTGEVGWNFKVLLADGTPLTSNPVDYTIAGIADEQFTFQAAAWQSGSTGQQASTGQAAPALVTIVFQNASNGPIDIFFDNPQGEQEFLMTLAGGMELVQESPVGAVWRLANESDWLDSVRVTEAPTQLVRYPEGTVR